MWISSVKKEESPVNFGCSVLINEHPPPRPNTPVSVVQAGLELFCSCCLHLLGAPPLQDYEVLGTEHRI